MTLGEYLKAATATPWKWAEHDCSAWPARWAGIPLPRYTSEQEALEHIDRAGGLVELWSECIGDSLARVDEPEPGDVGVVHVISERGPTLIGGIYTGKRWAFLTPKGLACVSMAPEHVSAVWRV